HRAELIEVEWLHPAHGPSNKLTQLASSTLAEADRVVLCDCDLAFCGDLSPITAGQEVRAKLVDLANPPVHHWRWLLAEAGFHGAPRLAEATYDGQPTFANNFNGGLYVLPQAAFLALRTVWPRWNSWVLQRSDRLGRWAQHADQISFGLAIEELGLDVSRLRPEMNFPSHLDYADRAEADVADPRVLHYHHLNERSRLTGTGLAHVDAAIGRVNRLLDELDAEASLAVGSVAG